MQRVYASLCCNFVAQTEYLRMQNNNMARMNWNQLLSDTRWGKEMSGSHGGKGVGRRNHFEQDYDRLIFSPAFRRLQNKAQIFPLPGNVFVHNRLTHTLEVSCVGRSIGNKVGEMLQQKYSDLSFTPYHLASVVAAACLAHDLGNPPFGHSGERAISAYFKNGEGCKWKSKVEDEGGRWTDFTHFEGNANTFRLLTHDFVGRRKGGFGLTYSTLASIVKYPYSSTEAGDRSKFGFFAPEEKNFAEIAQHLGLLPNNKYSNGFCRHPLVYIVEAADDICYGIMDIEDAYKLRIVSYDEVTTLFKSFFSETEIEYLDEVLIQISDKNEQIAYLRSKVINTLVELVSDTFIEFEDKILEGTFSGSMIHALKQPAKDAYRAIETIAYNRIYVTRDVVDVELAGHTIFAELIDKMMSALENPSHSYSKAFLNRVSSQYDIHQTSTYDRILTTLDYISGMTDLYALDLYRKIKGMNLPHV